MEYNAVELRRRLTRWLTETLVESPPEENTTVFGIGIVEIESDFQLYLFGANQFDEVSNSWAIDPTYKPSDGYIGLGQTGNHFADWSDCLVNVLSALSVILALPEISHSRLSGVPFFVGFDDGDLHRIR